MNLWILVKRGKNNMKQFLIIALLLFCLSGCAYRFAIIEKKLCSHPNDSVIKTERIIKSSYRWESDYTKTEIIEVKNRILWKPIFNPLYWFKRGEYKFTKCRICGQKFVEYNVTEKRINKIKFIKGGNDK